MLLKYKYFIENVYMIANVKEISNNNKKNRRQVYLMFSGNEFHMCAPSYLNLLFPNLLCFGNEHKER